MFIDLSRYRVLPSHDREADHSIEDIALFLPWATAVEDDTEGQSVA